MNRRNRSAEPGREDENAATVKGTEVRIESSSVEEHNTAVGKSIERWVVNDKGHDHSVSIRTIATSSNE